MHEGSSTRAGGVSYSPSRDGYNHEEKIKIETAKAGRFRSLVERTNERLLQTDGRKKFNVFGREREGKDLVNDGI